MGSEEPTMNPVRTEAVGFFIRYGFVNGYLKQCFKPEKCFGGNIIDKSVELIMTEPAWNPKCRLRRKLCKVSRLWANIYKLLIIEETLSEFGNSGKVNLSKSTDYFFLSRRFLRSRLFSGSCFLLAAGFFFSAKADPAQIHFHFIQRDFSALRLHIFSIVCLFGIPNSLFQT